MNCMNFVRCGARKRRIVRRKKTTNMDCECTHSTDKDIDIISTRCSDQTAMLIQGSAFGPPASSECQNGLKGKGWNIHYFRIIKSTEKSEMKSTRRPVVIHAVKSCWLSRNDDVSNMKCRLADSPAMTTIFPSCRVELLAPQWRRFPSMRINNSLRFDRQTERGVNKMWGVIDWLIISLSTPASPTGPTMLLSYIII